MVRAGGKIADGKQTGEVRHGIVGIVDRIAPILHIVMYATLHGKHFPLFDQLHDIRGPACFQRRTMEDDIDSCKVIGIPLNVMCNRVSIDHRDSTLITDHGDERQELAHRRFHFLIDESKWLSLLNVIYDDHHILRARCQGRS